MKNRANESGSVFFYIMLAIVLLGSLSFAVSQGNRSSVQALTDDREKLVASEIVSFGDTLEKAVTQLRLRGTGTNEFSFANPFMSAGLYGTYNTAPRNEIFNPTGGAVVFRSAPPEATVSANVRFEFLASNEIEEIGSTCSAPSCSDLIVVVEDLIESVCIRINDNLGVTNPGGVPPTDSDIDEAGKYAAATNPFSYVETIGDEDSALAGQSEACFEETSDSEFVYYKVLLPR